MEDDSGDEPPPLPEGPPPSNASANGHTPESIARLPPKLRQRLVQRGILKEADVQLALQAQAQAPQPKVPMVAPAAAVKAKAQPLNLPPMPTFIPMDLAAPPLSEGLDMNWAMAMAAPPTLSPNVPEVKAPARAQQVYASAPVLKRPLECASFPSSAGEQSKEISTEPPEETAKRPKAEAPAVERSRPEVASEAPAPPPPGPPDPPPGPPLPPGWVRVPHEGEFYFWNMNTNEVCWDNPADKEKKAPNPKKEPKFTEEHRVLWTDLGKIIGRQGMNLKIIKASIGCEVHVPKQDKDGKGKDGKDGKGKGKTGKKGKMKDAEGNKIGRGIGDGSTKLKDDQFCTITVTADSAVKANGGKRCIEIMLGYGRNVERALADLGVEAKLPSLEEMTGVKTNKKKDVDPMDPASYSDAPVGSWSAGLKKPGQKTGGGGPAPRDSKTANAERF